MTKAIYSFVFICCTLGLYSAILSFENNTLVLPPNDAELILPDTPYDYSPDIPQHISDFMLGWGVDEGSLTSISDDIATLGRVLFYDKRLSGDNNFSCASCHQQALAFSDNVDFSEGIGDNLTTRNTMPLSDLGWQLGRSFFWDFRSNSLEDAVLQPILAAHELGKSMPQLIVKLEVAGVYDPLFASAYGDANIKENRIAQALAQFIKSMVSFDSRFDQVNAGEIASLTKSEENGRLLFESNCGFCHVMPHFGVPDPFGFFPGGNNGLDSVFTDLGMGGWTGDVFLNGMFKSPTLRNISVTAPYMHDGRFETLEDVIDFYSEGLMQNETSTFNWIFGEDFNGFNFTEGDKIDLLAFLETLTDETLLSDERWSNPWQSTTSIGQFTLKGVDVFPNPIEDQILVELENPIGATYYITIYDLHGKLLQSYRTNEQLLTIPRNDTPAGIYELQASDGKMQKTFKLIYQ